VITKKQWYPKNDSKGPAMHTTPTHEITIMTTVDTSVPDFKIPNTIMFTIKRIKLKADPTKNNKKNR
jgi:hypothetical protein